MSPFPQRSILVLRLRRDRAEVGSKRILLELMVVGDVADRALVAAVPPTTPPPAEGPPGAPVSVLARWGADAAELGMPLDPADLVLLRDRVESMLAAAGRSLGRALPQLPPAALSQASSRLMPGVGAAVWRLVADWEQRGLPGGLPRLSIRLPERIAHPLRALCEQQLAPGEPLWLEIAGPASYLPLVPWERLVGARLGVPVLRLSYHPVGPTPPDGPLRVVVCLSGAHLQDTLTAGTLRPTLLAIRAGLPRGSTVEVFADRGTLAMLGTAALAEEIRVHAPPALPAEGGGSGRLPRVEHPWVEWMTRVLGGRAVDLVHWISPGVLHPDRGRVAVMADPAAEQPAWKLLSLLRSSPDAGAALRYVGAEEMHQFLNRLGAWGAVFSTPDSEVSRLGMRFLVDDLARLRPGPCALHDLGRGTPESLAQLYRFVTDASVTAAPEGAGLLLYQHPRATGQAPAPASSGVVHDWEVARARLGTLQQSPNGQWAAASQRVLEQSVAQSLSADADNPLVAATRRGRANGIAFVSRLLAEAAADPPPEGTP